MPGESDIVIELTDAQSVDITIDDNPIEIEVVESSPIEIEVSDDQPIEIDIVQESPIVIEVVGSSTLPGPPGPNVEGVPTLPASGDYQYQLVYNEGDGLPYIWTGIEWQPLGEGGSGSSGYELADQDDADVTYVYVGYEHISDGSWYIYRRTRATNVRLYASGDSSYASAWSGRDELSYT